jgi:ribosomal-protein-alanine N-acetyltransferase
MQTRRAHKSDLSILVKLDTESNLTHWSLSDYQESLNNKQHFIYVVEEHGKIVACTVFSIVIDEAEILQFWVENNSKRRGLGLYLLNYILTELRQRFHVLRVFLEVRDGNKPAINLYLKLGFVEVGRRQNYYNVDTWQFDALIMHKQFSECML